MDQLREIATQLGIDETFYIVFATLVAFYFLLTPLYLKPFQKLINKRKASTDGQKQEAEKMAVLAEEKFGQYRDQLRAVTEQSKKVMREAEEGARKEESLVMTDAAAKAKNKLQDAQKQLDGERKSAIEALSAEIDGISVEIATKVLGRPVGAGR